MEQSKISLLPLRRLPSPAPRSPEQLGLWPLKALRVYPSSEVRGSGYAGEIVADNGLRYFVKTQTGCELVPFTELFSYELCRAISIATPAFERIEMPDGLIAFGSRNELASVDGSALADLIAGDVTIHHSVGMQLSRLLALDAFLPNLDRAFKNLRWLSNLDSSSTPPSHSGGPVGALIALATSPRF